MANKDTARTGGASARGSRRAVVALGIATMVAVAVAVVFAVLWGMTRVPGDAAAKVDDEYVTETEVADYINQARIANSTTDDAAFATWLSSQGYSVASYRNYCIGQIATDKLVDARAEELGIAVEDSEVDAQIETYKNSLAFGDDSIWASTIEQQGMTEGGLRAQIATNLRKQKLYEKEVARREASDEETLAYVKANAGGKNLRHSLRLVFTGDDAWKRARRAYKTLSKAGDLDADTFAAFAAQNAKDDTTELSQGDYKWSDATDMPDEISDELAKLDVGELSQPFTVEDDDATEILYCDVNYDFPSTAKIDKLEFADMPELVQDHMAQVTSDALYQTDCANYLAWLLARAQVTYYPVPREAAYNVDMSQAGTQTSDAASSADSAARSSEGSLDNG